jgi:hypothetical protein
MDSSGYTTDASAYNRNRLDIHDIQALLRRLDLESKVKERAMLM